MSPQPATTPAPGVALRQPTSRSAADGGDVLPAAHCTISAETSLPSRSVAHGLAGGGGSFLVAAAQRVATAPSVTPGQTIWPSQHSWQDNVDLRHGRQCERVTRWLRSRRGRYVCQDCIILNTGVAPKALVNQIVRPLRQAPREWRYEMATYAEA